MKGDIKMKTGKFRYEISSTNESSDKYGKCDVCGKHASEVFHQMEEQYYRIEHDGKVYEGWTKHECHDHFGHEQCLLAQRRTN